MKNVASYCLFWCGRDEHSKLYTNGLRATVLAHHAVYPGFELRIHHDGTLHKDDDSARLIRFAEMGLVKLVHVGPADRICEAMLWRMLPVWDEGVDYTLCRDLDGLVTPRERLMTEDFIASGAGLHCINDHPQHSAPIMGGMCSFRGDVFRTMTRRKSFQSFISGARLDAHGDDQLLLRDIVWPAMLRSLCEHRICGREMTPGAVASLKWTRAKENDIKDVAPEVMARGDSLVPFIGVPGFDFRRAEEFYLEHGNQDVASLVRSVP